MATAEPLNLEEGIGRRELRAVRERFLELQQRRLGDIAKELDPSQRRLLRLLPLLFHVNHPVLPGFVSEGTATGIAGYEPGRTTLQAARHFGRSFRYRRQALRQPMLEALYLIDGEGGEFDLWLCLDPACPEAGEPEVAAKAEKVTAKGGELGLTLRFHLVRAAKIRETGGEVPARGRPVPLDDFYRLGLLLAGRPPLWWFVPPRQEDDYTAFTARLLQRRFLKEDACIDFGGLGEPHGTPVAHLLRYHLDQALRHPCRTLAPLLFTAESLREFPGAVRLATELKEAVYAGRLDAAAESPRRRVEQRVEATLAARGQPHRVALLRQTRPGQCPPHSLEEHLRLGSLLGRELLYALRLLEEFGETHGEGAAPRGGHVARRLRLLLETGEGKVLPLFPALPDTLTTVADLSLIQMAPGEWGLFRGTTAHGTPLRQGRNLLELLAWAVFNGVARAETRLHLLQAETEMEMEPAQLHALQRILLETPPPRPEEVAEPVLAQPPRLTTCHLFVNLAHDPFAALTRSGQQMVSNRSDPLSFGGARLCLVERLDTLTITQQGEVRVTRHQGAEGVLQALCMVLDQSTPGDAPARLEVHGCGGGKATVIAQRVQQLFDQALALFGPGTPARFACLIGDAPYLLQRGGRGIYWLRLEGIEELLEELGQPGEEAVATRLLPPLLQQTPLPRIYDLAVAGRVNGFYTVEGEHLDLYLLDQTGALYRERLQGAPVAQTLGQLQSFYASLAGEEGNPCLTVSPLQRLQPAGGGGWQPAPADRVEGDWPQLTLIIEGDTAEAAALEFHGRRFGLHDVSGDGLDDLARSLLEHHGEAALPPRITALHCPGPLTVGAALLFRQRQSIEGRLGRSLRRLLEG